MGVRDHAARDRFEELLEAEDPGAAIQALVAALERDEIAFDDAEPYLDWVADTWGPPLTPLWERHATVTALGVAHQKHGRTPSAKRMSLWTPPTDPSALVGRATFPVAASDGAPGRVRVLRVGPDLHPEPLCTGDRGEE